MKKSLVSVVIPTYNEKKNILVLINGLKDLFERTEVSFQVVVVDDDSEDGTAELVRNYAKIHKFVDLISRKGKERGLGLSILEGILSTRGDVVVGMDADFNHHPKYLRNILNKLKKGRLVVGSRFTGGHWQEKLSYLPSYVFNLSLRIIGFPIMDNTSGYYAIHRSDLLELPVKDIYRGYGDYHLRLVYFAHRMGIEVVEVPIRYGRRRYGESKSRWIKMILNYYRAAFRLILKGGGASS